MQKICAVMIVKNEAHIISRAIRSIVDHVDYILVCDTGSDVEQQRDMIKQLEAIIEAEGVAENWDFICREWRDFAWNRTEAMRAAEDIWPDVNYIYMIDADDYITQWDVPGLMTADAYHVTVINGNITFPRLQMFKAHIGWRYRGVVHEFPQLPAEVYTPGPGNLPIRVVSTRDGARSQDPDKYMNDATLLAKAIIDERDTDLLPRYQFYLAQSYDNAGDTENALIWYDIRADNDLGYTEERYVSLYRYARIRYAQLVTAPLEIVNICKAAQNLCPNRREAACLAMQVLNSAGEPARALAIWRQWPILTLPSGLFVEPEVYRWRMYEQAGLAAYYSGEFKRAVNYFAKALAGKPELPFDLHRLIANLNFAVDKL